MRKLIEIQQVRVEQRSIFVNVATDETEKEIRVNRSKFEDWINRTGRLAVDAGLLFSDPDQGIFNEPAIQYRSFQDYYLSDDKYEDMKDFLLIQNAGKLFDSTLKNIQSICNEFSPVD